MFLSKRCRYTPLLIYHTSTILTYKLYFRHFHFQVRRTHAYPHKKPCLKSLNTVKDSFIHSLVRAFIHSFVNSFIRSCVHSFIHLLSLSFFLLFSHSFIHSFIYSFVEGTCITPPRYLIRGSHPYHPI